MDVRVRWLLIDKPASTVMIELLVCLTIIGAMTFGAARSWHRAWPRFDVMEAVDVMTAPKIAMMEYHAVTGTWPASNQLAGYSSPEATQGGRISSVVIRDGGAVDFTLSGRAAVNFGKVITIRAWEVPDAARRRSPGSVDMRAPPCWRPTAMIERRCGTRSFLRRAGVGVERALG